MMFLNLEKVRINLFIDRFFCSLILWFGLINMIWFLLFWILCFLFLWGKSKVVKLIFLFCIMLLCRVVDIVFINGIEFEEICVFRLVVVLYVNDWFLFLLWVWMLLIVFVNDINDCCMFFIVWVSEFIFVLVDICLVLFLIILDEVVGSMGKMLLFWIVLELIFFLFGIVLLFNWFEFKILFWYIWINCDFFNEVGIKIFVFLSFWINLVID